MRILLLLVLLVLPAFFAAVEVALLRLRTSRVRVLDEQGVPGADAVHRLQRRMRRALLMSQLGTVLSLLALGWAGSGVARDWLQTHASADGLWWDLAWFLLLVLLTTLVAGVLPRAWVLSSPERAALTLAPVLEAVMRVLRPLLSVLGGVASLLLQLLGLPARWDSLGSPLTAGELETLIESGGVTGLRPDERNILEGVFALRDTQVREVMVPRSGMVTLPVDVRFAELMEAVHSTRHARFPVIGQSLDDVRGVLDLRLLAEPIARGLLDESSPLEPYLIPAERVLETSTLAELLALIRNGHPLLLVVDEHGGTEGLVTAADLTGEIVGVKNRSPNLKFPIWKRFRKPPVVGWSRVIWRSLNSTVSWVWSCRKLPSTTPWRASCWSGCSTSHPKERRCDTLAFNLKLWRWMARGFVVCC